MPTAALRPCSVCRQLGCTQHKWKRERERSNYAVRRWYRTARWDRLREQVLRDNTLCVDCQKEGRTTVATDVHHREKHGGDIAKFFDRTGLEGLCASHHSMHTARGE